MRPRPGASPRASAGNGAVGCLRLTPCKRPHRRGLSQGDGGHTAVALSAPATRNGSTDVVFGQAVAFSFPTHASVDRRSFLAASSMLCLTSGVLPKTHKLVAKADAHARSASASHSRTSSRPRLTPAALPHRPRRRTTEKGAEHARIVATGASGGRERE